MVLLSLPVVASANGETTYWSDSGNYDTSWYYENTSAEAFVLSSAEELAGLSVLVNNGNTFSGKTVKLGADINLDGHNWTPIGKYVSESDNKPFAGSFDGQGYVISNMVASGNYSAFFSYVIAGAVIKNIVIKNLNLTGLQYIAGIVAYANATDGEISLENCTVNGEISNGSYIAAIISYIKTGNGKMDIKNCTNYARVNCHMYSGGIIGYIESDNNSSDKKVTISNCYNYELVYGGNNAYCCGGIVGYATDVKFERCVNFADVRGNAYSDDNGAAFFGGICGRGLRSDFVDCANYGAISAFYVGGMTYGNRNTAVNCVSYGELSYASPPDSTAYPIIATNDKVDNCYYLAGIVNWTEDDYRTGITVLNSLDFSSGKACYLLNNSTSKGDVIWGQNIDNGEPVQEYPVIGGAKVYFIDGKYTNAPEHNFDEGVVIVEPMCTKKGEAVYTCLDCDYKFTEILNNHRYESVATTTWPTHTEEGIKTYKCSCGNIYTESIEKLEGHTYKSVVTKEATHMEEGITTYTCACGDYYTKPIEKTTQHNYSRVVTPPTCLERGYTTYICECGYSFQTSYVNTVPHTYTSSITTPATHLAEGVKTFTCECGDSYTESVAKLEGHTYTSKTTTPATHLTEGVKTYTCECGDTYTEPIAKTKEHTYTVLNVVAPSCEKDGYTIFICECGESYNDKMSTTGHNYEGDYCVTCGESKVENCTCNCHKGGFNGFIWKLLRFFYKLFGMNKTCACGIAHY